MNIIEVSPAYGRDYATPELALAAWRGGKDFRISDTSNPDFGSYINAEDAEGFAVDTMVRIYFRKLTKHAVILFDGKAAK